MKKWNNYIFYLIGSTLLLAVGVQSYWNYKNYKENKQRITNEIQQTLNDAVEEYYAVQAKKNTLSIVSNNEKSVKKMMAYVNMKLDSTEKHSIENISIIKRGVIDKIGNDTNIQVFRGKAAVDSIKLLKKVTSIVISITSDTIDFQQLDSVFYGQLLTRNMSLTYGFQHWKDKVLFYENNAELVKSGEELQAISTFLKEKDRLLLRYNPPTKEIFLRSLLGILLSVFLMLAILGSLWYLLYIIRKQKQLSEMKNDLISNITHEFKTPITTASAAIEAMQNFKVLEDRSKTENYLKVSENQLKKLHLMVEKLLETASLDSAAIRLEKENVDLVSLLQKQVVKFAATTTKSLQFETSLQQCKCAFDEFHFENTVDNIIDNAIKYGGEQITVLLRREARQLVIEISDNGVGIKKQHRAHIFDKFYRIPSGNRHDVKGFGIGLYYAQQIVKKHGGTLELLPNVNETTFRIILPNGCTH